MWACSGNASTGAPSPGPSAVAISDQTPSSTAPASPGASPSRAATPSPNPTPAPTRVPAEVAAAPCLAGTTAGSWLQTNGTSLTCEGVPLALTGFTFYPALIGGSRAWHSSSFPAYIDHVLDMGAAAGQNAIRATDQWDPHTAGQSVDDPVLWSNMDYLMKAAQQRGVFVVLDLSAFRWLLESQGRDWMDPSAWLSFIDMATARYKNAPALAFYSIVGEPAPPTTAAQSQALLAFYRTTSQEIRKDDPDHLIGTGSLNHMQDHPELSWWQTIDALPTIDLVTVETYSQHDLNLMPAIAEYGKSVGKPVFEEEFGMPQGNGDGAFAGGAAYNGLSTGRGPFFESVYQAGWSLGYAGFIFWNMGCQTGSGSYEVSPKTPAVWSVVARNAAVTAPGATSSGRALC